MIDITEQLRRYGALLDDLGGVESVRDLERDALPSTTVGDDLTRGKPLVLRSVGLAFAFVVLVSIAVVSLVLDYSPRSEPHTGVGQDSTVRVPLSELPSGMSAGRVKGTPVFFLRERDRVTTFISNTQHLPQEYVLRWCPEEEVFISATHGEAFDKSGAAIGGPARVGLDRLATAVRGRVAEIDYARVIRDDRSVERFYNWYPPCRGGIESKRFRPPRGKPSAKLAIRVLPGNVFDQPEYRVPEGVIEIRYQSDGETDGFEFSDPRLAGFALTTKNGLAFETVRLLPGRYRISTGIGTQPSESTIVVTPHSGR